MRAGPSDEDAACCCAVLESKDSCCGKTPNLQTQWARASGTALLLSWAAGIPRAVRAGVKHLYGCAGCAVDAHGCGAESGADDAVGSVVGAAESGSACGAGALPGGLIGCALPLSSASNCSEAMRCSLSSRAGLMRIASATSSSSYVERSVSARGIL